jgi:beta-glucosidase
MRFLRRSLPLIAGAIVTAGSLVIPPGGLTTASDSTPTASARAAALLSKMTLDEKLGQLQQQVPQPPGVLEGQAAQGKLGAVLDLTGAANINALQHVAVDQSRLHIPLLFGLDTIHGYRTIFPIPLGEASSFDPSVAQTDASTGADESAHNGIKQVFAPMIDVSHDPRWGRVAEGAGEDPFLGSAFAVARVQGSQGTDMSAPDKVVATAKHFVAYGQPEGGRDYNTADMSTQRLWNFYLPPFKAAVGAGVGSVMSAFDPLNGVPTTANHYTETEILKEQWGFNGFIDSDYTAVQELIAHGLAADGADAARLALNAGTDMEMVSTNYVTYGRQLLAQHLVTMQTIDDAVHRILTIKFRAGLFDHPYVDESQAAAHTLTAADRSAARTAADRSMVLLKNANSALPLSAGLGSIAVVGPAADSQQEILGTPGIGAVGQAADAVSVLSGIKAAAPGATVTYAPGCVDATGAADLTCASTTGFAAAAAAAQNADVTVLVVGEPAAMSGEAESRSNIDLIGREQQLVDAIKATQKPFVVVLMNGRPLTIPGLDAAAPAILEAWFPGIEGGNAIADILFGKVNPGGKLPDTFPQNLGQIPLYYNHENTGRPPDPNNKYTSKYNDGPFTPLYEFGYGLSYSTFQFSNLNLSSSTLRLPGGSIAVSADVQNTSGRGGDEVVQLYIHDPVASIVQPVRRLRGFQRVTLGPGEKKTVRFTLNRNDVGFYDNSGRFVVEPGRIDAFVGDSSSASLSGSFNVVGRGEGG